MTEITKEQWLAKCAKRFSDLAALDETKSMELAEICFESLGSDLTEDPEDAANEEMSYWTDDGED